MTTAATTIHHSARRFPFLREIAGVLAAYFAYFAVRGATEGDVALAMEHARLVERFERALGLFIEPQLQAAILSERWLVDLANWVYVWGHWPVIAAVALWLYRSSPERYRLTRNAFLISGAIGLVIFTTFPVAPPRLADMGLVDTVVQRSNFYHVLQPPSLTNQFAAVPSLHSGWNLLIGIALFRESRHPVGRVIGVLLPVAMLAAVVLTANHYLVDTVAGGTIALIALRGAYLIQTGRLTLRHPLSAAARSLGASLAALRSSGARWLAGAPAARPLTALVPATAEFEAQRASAPRFADSTRPAGARTAPGRTHDERGCGPATRSPDRTAGGVYVPARTAAGSPGSRGWTEDSRLGAARLSPARPASVLSRSSVEDSDAFDVLRVREHIDWLHVDQLKPAVDEDPQVA